MINSQEYNSWHKIYYPSQHRYTLKISILINLQQQHREINSQQKIQKYKLKSKKSHRTFIFQMNSLSQINIILTEPTLPSDQYIVVHTTSPVKKFAYAKSIEDVSQDYKSLFEESEKKSEDGLINLSNLKRRKLNMGEKVRNKVESTNNKSDSLRKPLSTFQSRSSQWPSSLYSNQYKNQNLHPDNLKFVENLSSSCYSLRRMTCQAQQFTHENQSVNSPGDIQTHSFQCQDQILNQVVKKQKQISTHQQFEEQMPQIPIETSSYHSSPYNNFSAKTQNCSDSLFHRKDHSPIQELKDSNDQEIPSSKIKLLNFNDQSEIQKESFQSQSQAPIIKVSEPQDQPGNREDEFVQSLKIVQSRVVDRPYFGSIENIQSRCVSCQELTWQNPYEYALYQLNLLKQNVTSLQISTNYLVTLKNSHEKQEASASEIPSSIKKQQNLQKLDESFILQLEKNFNGVFQTERKQNDDESLLIGEDSRRSHEIVDLELERDNKYRTPHSEGNYYTQQSNNGKALSQQINIESKNRNIEMKNKTITRALVKNKQYYDLHKLVQKENS